MPALTASQPLPPTRTQRMITRYSKQIWGPMMSLADRLPPRLLARVAARLTPQDFARAIASAPPDRLAATMEGPMRSVILDEVVRRMESEFMPDRAGGMDAVIELRIGGRPGGGFDVYQLVIRDNRCVAVKDGTEESRVALELSAVDFLKLTSGIERGMDLYLGGALKFNGQAILLTRLTSMFQIPDGRALVADAR